MAAFTGSELVFRRERRCELSPAQFDAGALGPGQLLVRTCYSLISQGTETANYTGLDPGTRKPGSWNHYPHRPGYAAIGTVAAVGGDAEFAAGDLVFAITRHASYGVADPGVRPVVKLSADDDPRTLILCRMASIAMTGLRQSASVDLGARAAVVGLGLVGLFAAQLLRLAGLDVLGVDTAGVRRDAATAAGVPAQPAGDVGEERPLEVRRTAGPDLVIEASGSPAGLRLALELVRDGGEVVLLGTPRGAATSDATDLMAAVHYRGLRLVGAYEYLLPLRSSPPVRWSLYDSYHTLTGLLRSGALRLGGWQVRTVRPADAQAVYSELADSLPRAEAVVFDWAR